ncbi:DUF805 domain-containing protein [uncultured Muribaculum sp.]|uniref:DUF805 domain-containing protein n=1 Tax=uncultured Muribaculum sp. TaxID=1918613 RepID=UPI002729843C|nr:DUF805 domain-containing protein [uncultured Muribaculum sp.]
MENYQQQGYNPQMPNPETSYLGFVDAVKICFNKYADFKGRATRAEYWWWYLCTVLVSLVLGWIPFLGWAVSVALLVPTLAVSWRRMHDIGKGGGWWFINFIPLVGWILWIVWCCQQSEPMPNRFGPRPC